MQEGYGNFELAHIFSLRGIWNNAEQELNIAQGIFEKINHTQGLGLDSFISRPAFPAHGKGVSNQ